MKKKVIMQLIGLDGNAYSIMGAFSRNAKHQGWTEAEVKAVLDEAMSGDYDHLLATIMDNVEFPDEEEEDKDEDEEFPDEEEDKDEDEEE
jgi:hypothetical protein